MARTLLALACVALAVACASAASPATWYDCTSGSTIASIDNVVINPNPPAIKANTTVTGTGTLTGTIEAGSEFNVEMYYSGIRLFAKSGDVCTDSSIELPLGLGRIFVEGLDCPVAAGSLTITEKAFIDINPPRGEYKIQLTASQPGGTEIVCVGIKWDA